ncbi:MAG: hypothetical protein M3072_10110 [Candidatus Dormibacteraeota bacterium]|nr:hypothetical protein [Candidatus Dormibacteraeota bacterium]
MAKHSLTLDGLADLVRKASARDGGYSRVTAQLACKWRSGEVTPGRQHVRWLALALRLPVEMVAAYAQAQRPAPKTSEHPGPLLLLPPDTVDYDYVAAVKQCIQQLVRLDNLLGGNDIASVSKRLLVMLQRQLREKRYYPHVELEFRAATAELAELTGWLLFDADRHDEANDVNKQALFLARSSVDRGMEALTLINMALEAQHLQRSREALAHARCLQQISCSQSRRVRSVAYLREARALSQLGAESDTKRAVNRARSLYLDGAHDSDPAWAWWIDDSEFTFHEGMCHAELGEFGLAIDLIHQAIDITAPNRIRDGFLYRSYLLDVLAQVSAWQEIEDVGEEILVQVEEIGSRRALSVLLSALERTKTSPQPGVRNAGMHLIETLQSAGYCQTT